MLRSFTLLPALALASCLSPLASCLAGTHIVFGHSKDMSISAVLSWGTVPLPTTLTWEIAAAAGPRLGWTVPITSTNTNGLPLVFEVTEANAAAAGVDWSAWHSALNDRAYARSFLTLGGVEKEFTLLHFLDYGAPFDLDLLKLEVTDHGTQRVGFYPGIRAMAIDYDAIPEPASWLLLCVGLLWVGRARR